MQQFADNDSLSKARALLLKAKPNSLSAQFASFCRSALQAKKTGQLSSQQAAMAIAGCMFIDNLDGDPLREEITMMAGELEVPREPKETTQRWTDLERLIVELENTARTG